MKKTTLKNKFNLTLLCSLLFGLLCLQGCASNTLSAPCDNYGNHCDPKIKINQWTPTH